MKYTFAILLSVAPVFAQNTASMGSVPTGGSMASITDMSAPMATPASLASVMAEASCLTGAAYMSCQAKLTNNGVVAACTTGDVKAIESCGCSIASIAVSCAEMCSLSIDQALIASVSTTCKSLVGIGVPTTGAAGATKTGAAAGASVSGSGARPTGLVDGVAALAVAGVIGALL